MSDTAPRLIGHSDEVKGLNDFIDRSAQCNSTVLIEGETGTGKEVVAKLIHSRSPRTKGPLVIVNCSAIPETLLESELFGFRKGSFTNANANHTGFFESAHGGTIFLDEIGDMPLGIQPKLLRVLQEREITPIGSTLRKKIDFRLICATNHNLKTLVRENKFREDLFHRLNVLSIRLSPLRNRKDDIPQLVEHFTHLYAEKTGRGKISFEKSALDTLLNYPFPGNIRELENIVERIYALNPRDIVNVDDIMNLTQIDFETSDFEIETEFKMICRKMGLPTIDQLYRLYLDFVWDECNFKIDQAAKILGVSTKTIRRKLKTSANVESQADSISC